MLDRPCRGRAPRRVFEILREEASRLARPAARWRDGAGEAAWIAESGGRVRGVRGVDDRGVPFEAWLRGQAWTIDEEAPSDWPWRAVSVDPWRSYPSIDHLFLHGDERIGRWLQSHGWARDWPYNANFGGRADVEAYEAWWMDSHPFYAGDALALVGGWPFRWPDEDDLESRAHLVLWTCTGEPFVELWREGDKLRVVERVT